MIAKSMLSGDHLLWLLQCGFYTGANKNTCIYVRSISQFDNRPLEGSSALSVSKKLEIHKPFLLVEKEFPRAWKL